ncbi:hypothetical protein [Polynucleobacter rarus]|uniref:hypothetical protein n=1 Tax=Polynucleobacter rarus TaxID=556055 RepID=UPI000D3E80AE|nr:hypothetical protein [Polynucleobacter rarus]
MELNLSATELYQLSCESSEIKCEFCDTFQCESWETLPSSFVLSEYPVVGNCRFEGSSDIWEEYHPDKTTMWSNHAPIALRYYPYNRSDVVQCSHCKRVYLRYTEFGGYYVDQRIRLVNPSLIVLEEDASS